jgi:hypothetical protein
LEVIDDLAGNILSDVARPTLCRVEGNHADWPLVLTAYDVLNDSLSLSFCFVRLAENAPVRNSSSTRYVAASCLPPNLLHSRMQWRSLGY